MRRDWLLYLVIFSLALNVGTIGTFTYLRYRDRQEAAVRPEPPPLPMPELWRRLNLDPEQRRTFRQLRIQHRRRVGALRRELARKRRELFTLLRTQDSSDWPAVQAKIREVSELQGKLEEEIIRHLLNLRRQLRPAQKEVFLRILEKRLRPFRRHRGPRWPHPGIRHRPGPPEPALPPPPPAGEGG
ncbi:MAG: periplasmic heavy metal sensor [Deltaproteobacteria bacterium]|nr:periplasmic heavy metal sensor [Deltaproteobacteria bacterium]